MERLTGADYARLGKLVDEMPWQERKIVFRSLLDAFNLRGSDYSLWQNAGHVHKAIRTFARAMVWS